MLENMKKYQVTGPFPVTGVQPGGFVDGSGIDNVELLVAAGILTPVADKVQEVTSKAAKAGEK
jgi:hypothetical protein